ncbi:hypothetical protein K4K60_000524 [Colletotrichum sp. SAR11_57]|nr:hypothetical protein K4K60_000524 [Colletotrichum sp. SAR11_57]
MLTGESLPVRRDVGDIIMGDSSATKSDGDALLDDIIKYFVTAVIFFAIVLPILEVFSYNSLHPNYQYIRSAVARSMTILMSACPCALGLAIPSAVATAVFEVNDATGHPLGKSIFSSGVKYLGEDWLRFQAHGETRDICSSAGQGVSGNVRIAKDEWHYVIVGSSQYLKAAGINDIPDHGDAVGSGKIEARVGVDGCYAGKMLVSDTVKAEAQSTIAALTSSGYKCSLLTGDMADEAHRVASHVGIPVLASQASPTDKLAFINASKKNGNAVAMVGDGLNDAPSLAAADVGFAVYHNNALATTGASIMILNSRIDLVCLAFKIAELTNQQITFNLRWTAAYNLLAFVMAVGWIKPFGFAMTPSVAAAMMSTSSIFITAQSFRLRTRLDNLP